MAPRHESPHKYRLRQSQAPVRRSNREPCSERSGISDGTFGQFDGARACDEEDEKLGRLADPQDAVPSYEGTAGGAHRLDPLWREHSSLIVSQTGRMMPRVYPGTEGWHQGEAKNQTGGEADD
jgi:hypothetical protein